MFGNTEEEFLEDYLFGLQYRTRIVEFMKTGQATELKPWDENRIANLINKESISIYDFQNCDELDKLECYAKV